MPSGGKSLIDSGDYDHVDGAIVGRLDPDAPDPMAPTWALIQAAEWSLRECAAVVSYVADAEERRGHAAAAEHYRHISGQAALAIPVLHRLSTGTDGLPPTMLDEVRTGVARLTVLMDRVDHRLAR